MPGPSGLARRSSTIGRRTRTPHSGASGPTDPSPRSPRACRWTLSSHETEERTDLLHVRLGLLERRKVAALVELVPVADVAEAPLGPAARRAEDLLGED